MRSGRRTVLIAGFLCGPLFAAFGYIPWLSSKETLFVIIAMAIPAAITSALDLRGRRRLS